ncbi:hypothetical protein PV08_11697 [Exophiala spinifera]|uniref:Transcription factor domain-containing protein n=1 Tax=Exophiala spinifera TaxID=91928 RepID=A0A0D1Y4R5_9EURO|nr:uncharacterized protein PV08_11697 [Exophiala spinifera]KIW09921.1 hypothetical protein PV08_11697 [Exophiala spinifera]
MTPNIQESHHDVLDGVHLMATTPPGSSQDTGPRPSPQHPMTVTESHDPDPSSFSAQSPFVALSSAIIELSPARQLSSLRHEDENFSVFSHSQNPLGLSRPTITEQTLVELLELLLYYIPVVGDTDFDDPLAVVRNRPCLAYCAGYVAAQYAIGCARVRAPLLARVTEFIHLSKRRIPSDQDLLWTELQAFAILYAYQPVTDIFNLPHSRSDQLSHWDLKSFVESFALRAGLHRSLESVRSLLEEGSTTNMADSRAFQDYTYWLWLFTMSHHFSLMTRTPPSIRADVSITTATELLKDISKPSRVTRIVAEVDLYMLWSHAGRYLPELAEWWCTPSSATDIDDTSDISEDVAAALELWAQRWGVRGEAYATVSDLDVTRNAAVEFHLRATRFHIGCFITGWNLRRVTTARKTTRLDMNDTVRRSLLSTIQAACDVFKPYLDMPPLRREKLRYIPDQAFALIAFCCLYIINAVDLFGASSTALSPYLETVYHTGIFLQEMAVASSTNPPRYGGVVLDRLDQLKSTTHPADQVANVRSEPVQEELAQHRRASQDLLCMRRAFS